MRTFNDDIYFEGRVSFGILPDEMASVINSATPSVENARVFTLFTPQAITNFTGGSDNQTIRILGDGTTTVANNVNIQTNTGAVKVLASNKVYVFTLINNIWYEDA